MIFKIELDGIKGQEIPINYQYPLSAALYRIIAKGNAEYASFLHETGYGKGFKFFSFSQIHSPFKIVGSRMQLTHDFLYFYVSFHLPQAMESFVKGLFKSEEIVIADKESKGIFKVKSITSIQNPLQDYKDTQIVNITLKPDAPLVSGIKNENGHYTFLAPTETEFIEALLYNWRQKITTAYDAVTGSGALLLMELDNIAKAKSRLITIKAATKAETKVRGWMNFELQITAEKRFVELLLNAGIGLYNAQGFGFLNVIDNKK